MKSKITLVLGLVAIVIIGWLAFFYKPKPTPELPTPPAEVKPEEKKEIPAPEVKKEEKIEPKVEAPKVEEKPAPEVTAPEVIEPDAKKIAAELSTGEKITVKDVKDVFSTLPAQLKEVGLEKIYEALLTRLVDAKILLSAAIKAGIDKDPEVLKRIAEAQEALIQKAFLDQEIAKLINDTVLQDKYKELLNLLPKDQFEVKLSHILVRTEAEADEILKQLKSGKNFEDLVKEKSLDTDSKQKGGDLGYVRKDDLPKGFSDTVFKTAKGSIVAEPMKVGEVGYSILRVDDKRPVEPPKFEKVKDEIYKAISPEYAVKVIERLRKDSGVKKIGLDGKPLAEKTLEQRKAEAEAEAKGEKKPDQPTVDLKTLDDNMVVAEFPNGDKVKIADIKESMATLPPQLREVPFGKVYEPLLTRVVDMKLISAASRKDGLDKDSAVLKKIADAKNALTQKFFLEKEVAKLITPEMVNTKYQQLLKMIPRNEMEIRLRHILVKTKEDAMKVMKALKSGASFDEMVRTYSIDEQSKANNGDLGYVRRNELPKEFADAVFKAPKATLLPEPIQVGDIGFSIVRVEDKRPIEPPKLEEARGEIMKVLSAEQSVKVLEGLRQTITVKKFDMNGQPLPDKPAEPTKQATTADSKPVTPPKTIEPPADKPLAAPMETTTPKAAAAAAA